MWITKLLNDRFGNPSSKRITGFAITFLFVYLVLKSVNVEIDKEIFWGVFSAMLAVNGIVLAEGINQDKSKSAPADKVGCKDPLATNYDPTATIHDPNQCTYLAEPGNED